MKLRDYQLEVSDAVFEEWKDNVSTAVVCPTGTGKTIIMADIIRRVQPQKAMFLAHRQELVYQARDKIEKTTGLECEIEMGDQYASPNLFRQSSVIVSTVQTLNSQSGDRKRMGRFLPAEYGVLLIDECHHATATGYRNIINYFQQNPNLRVVGFTATPDRHDEEALGQIFGSVAYDYEILDAIHDGWLVPIDQQMVHVQDLDFSQIRTQCGDLNGADLSRVMEDEKNLMGVAGASVDIIGARRAIVFTASVAQAEALCGIFNRYQPGSSGWVCGMTNYDERRQLLQSFASGNIQIVCNCGVLTEGFDDPGVEIVIMARPTKSRALYSQMVGRSTRPLPGVVDGLATREERKQAIAASQKPSCLVVDFVGNAGKHKLMTSADILGGKVSDEAVARAIEIVKKSGKAQRMSDVLDAEEERIKQEAIARKQAEELRKQRLAPKVEYKKRFVSPFDAFNITPIKERGWDRVKPLSEKQREFLRRQGVDPDKMTAGQARQLINVMFSRFNKKLCTYKQAKILNDFGIPNARNLTMAEASAEIDKIAAGGWRRPKPASQPNLT